MAQKSRNQPQPRRRRRGRPRADERIPEGSRNRLLDAAVDVFARRGYERATVDEIAEAAGLSKGTVYWHFSSKAALFQALLEERVDRPAETVMEVTRTAPPEQPTAPAVGAGFLRMLAEQPAVLRLWQEYAVAAARDPEVRERYVRRQQRLREAVAETLRIRQQRLGGVPFAIPPEHLAAAFVALGMGLAMEAQVDPDAIPSTLYGDMLALVYDGNAARFGRMPDQREQADSRDR
jgi:AcrR family transcriptional regulator